MIRRSTVVAALALALSLLVHLLGLSLTRGNPEEPLAEKSATDVVAMGNAFEDLAETRSEPIVPEPAPVPEPPVETRPEPERAEIPTSDALVASSDPQENVLSPDTGSAKVVEPQDIGPDMPERTATAPARTAPSADAPKGDPEASMKPVDPIVAEPVPSPPVAPAPQPQATRRLAVLPVPVEPAQEASVVPVVPVEREETEPEAPVETPPEPSDAENDASPLAVISSLRPRLPEQRPQTDRPGLPEGEDRPNDLQTPPPQLIESPLTVYQRDGIDLTARRSGRVSSGNLGFLDSRGPGNSDSTNYVGQVLVHLNRAPAIRVSARGSARVFFEINPDGSLAWVDIIDSTGSSEIERAAKAQIRAAAPFPPPPGGAAAS